MSKKVIFLLKVQKYLSVKNKVLHLHPSNPLKKKLNTKRVQKAKKDRNILKKKDF